MYRSKTYRVREVEDIVKDIDTYLTAARRYGTLPKRVFLCDGDALGAPMDVLLPVLDHLQEQLPDLERVGIYATANNMLEKSAEELKQLADRKLTIAYLGLESGSDRVLKLIVKGNTAEDMIAGSTKLLSQGWKLSVMGMLGVGGREHSLEHTEETASVVSAIAPDYFSFLTTVAVPGTPYHTMVEKKKFIQPLTSKELLEEMKSILSGIQSESKEILFRANHVSNQFPLGGSLPSDTPMLLKVLNQWISECPEGIYPEARLSSM